MLGGPEGTPPAQTLLFSVTEIGPENAPDKTVTWSVWSNQACTTASAIATIPGGLLTLDATATPPAAANDKIWVKATANDAGAFSSDAIEITVVEFSSRDMSVREWHFNTNPSGWTAQNNSGATGSDYDYGNGMTLLNATGGTTIGAIPPSTARSMGVFLDVAVPVPNSADRTNGRETNSNPSDATAGYLNVNGAGNWARVTGIQGPFTIRIIFTTGSNNNQRWPAIKIGSGAIINEEGTAGGTDVNAFDGTGPANTGTNFTNNSLWVLQHSYTGTDTPEILLKASNGIRVFDVYIRPTE